MQKEEESGWVISWCMGFKWFLNGYKWLLDGYQ